MSESEKLVVLLLPGMDGTGSLFEAFKKQLPDNVQAEVVSYPTDTYLDYQKLAAHVRGVCPASVPFVVIAESYSGPIGAALIKNPPDNLRAVVFVASFISLPLGRAGAWIARLVPDAVFRLRPPAWLLRWLLMNSSVTALVIAEVQNTIARISPHVMAGRLREALRTRFEGSPETKTIRVAALLPENDRLLGRCALDGLRAAIPSLEVVKVAGPHFLLQCSPEKCAETLGKMGLLDAAMISKGYA